MLASFPPLAGYNPGTLAGKLAHLSELTGLTHEQVGALAWRCPRLLGCSLSKLEGRLQLLHELLHPELVTQALQEHPHLLSLAPRVLQRRLRHISSQLHLDPAQVRRLVQHHPQLLRSTNGLSTKLQQLRQLLLLQGSGGVDDQSVSAGNSSSPSTAWSSLRPSSSSRSRSSSTSSDDPILSLVLAEPRLLCFSPRTLAAKFDALAARSALPPQQVAATVLVQPQLLLFTNI